MFQHDPKKIDVDLNHLAIRAEEEVKRPKNLQWIVLGGESSVNSFFWVASIAKIWRMLRQQFNAPLMYVRA